MALRRIEDPITGEPRIWDDPDYNPVRDNPGGSYPGRSYPKSKASDNNVLYIGGEKQSVTDTKSLRRNVSDLAYARLMSPIIEDQAKKEQIKLSRERLASAPEYIDPGLAQRAKLADLQARQQKAQAAIERLPQTIQAEIRRYEREKVRLADGSYMSGDDWRKIGQINPEYQQIAKTKGFNTMVEIMLDDGIQVNGKKRGFIGPMPGPKRVTIGPATEPFLTANEREQKRLKEIYDKGIKQSFKQRLLNPLPVVIKNNDGTYTPLDTNYGGIPGLSEKQVKKAGAVVSMVPIGPGGFAKIPLAVKSLLALSGAYATAETVKEIKSAVDAYQKQTGVEPTADQVVLVNTDTGSAASLRQVNVSVLQPDAREGYLPTPMIPDAGIYSKTPIKADKGLITSFPYTPDKGLTSTTPAIPQTSVSIIDPMPKTRDAESYVLVASAAAAARRDFVREAQKAAPAIDWDKELTKAEKKINIREQGKRYSAYQRLKPDIRRRFVDQYEGVNSAYKAYLAKQALLAEARKSYVASVNPQPVIGAAGREVIYILAGYQLANYIKNDPRLSNQEKTELLNQVQADLANDLQTQSKSGTQLTINTETKTETQTDSNTQSVNKTDTITQTQTQSSARAKTEIGTDETTPVKTTENIRESETTKSRLKKPKESPDGKNSKKKPIKPGSLAWEQGALKAGEVVKYAEPPKYQVKTMVGKDPAGYKDTGNTPAETIQTIGGPVKRKVSVRIGVVTAHAEPDNKKITFTSNQSGKKIRIIEDNASGSRRSRSSSRRTGTKPSRARELGSGVVRDKRGQHLKLY